MIFTVPLFVFYSSYSKPYRLQKVLPSNNEQPTVKGDVDPTKLSITRSQRCECVGLERVMQLLLRVVTRLGPLEFVIEGGETKDEGEGMILPDQIRLVRWTGGSLSHETFIEEVLIQLFTHLSTLI